MGVTVTDEPPGMPALAVGPLGGTTLRPTCACLMTDDMQRLFRGLGAISKSFTKRSSDIRPVLVIGLFSLSSKFFTYVGTSGAYARCTRLLPPAWGTPSQALSSACSKTVTLQPR